MDSINISKKGILKKKGAPFTRSNSVDLDGKFPPKPEVGGGGAETPKKRAVILDENGVWRPGEQDDNEPTEGRHQLQCSLADRIAGERVSYRLIQQRSLDFGLYHQLHKCSLDKANDSHEHLDFTGLEEQCSTSSVSPPTLRPHTDDEVAGRLIVSHSPSEVTVLQMIHSKEVTKQFSLRDVLGHRVPELAEEEDSQADQNLLQDDIALTPLLPKPDTSF
ncbi:hypothetical protein FGIG_10009 [Fasciola gigantica]|uniref:Uncharacterized protein n=1 Tax=Fasciola gigantica TaxID=46835 RepID=A0A504YP62_FASGI|nr:hypothetical protein FGIG_10009 [Fasciola gigantica]